MSRQTRRRGDEESRKHAMSRLWAKIEMGTAPVDWMLDVVWEVVMISTARKIRVEQFLEPSRKEASRVSSSSSAAPRLL